jgi:outer membrane protein assembly factor BamB
VGAAPLNDQWKARLTHVWGAVNHFWHSRRGLAVGLLTAAVLLLGGAAVLAYELLKRPPDVHNADVPFEPQAPPKVRRAKAVNWPIFGLNPARTRYLAVRGVKPPFRKVWRFKDRPLLEFPPIYVGGKLYFVNNNGTAFALDADTGRILWERSVGRLNASSPAYYKHRLFIVNLVPGHIVKLDARTGKTIWKRPLPGRAESSPLVLDRTVYFGCEDGNLYALSTISGNVRWATDLGGPVKSAPAYYGGTLYVGDYGGYMNAVDAKTGKLEWQSGSLGPGFGAAGAFYSTPAVAFGRVYAGNNDNRVYSFDRRSGELAWTYSTGGYAYSGPAVANTRHSPPTVYIGSFDGNVYALDAKDGSVRWSRSAGGQVIGSLSGVGDIVYAAEFTHNSTSGFLMRNGRRVFRYRRGTYSPVISDGRRIFLTGYSSITALQPYKYKAAVARRIEAPQAKPVQRQRPQDGKRQAGSKPSAQGRPAGAAERRAGSGRSGGRPGGGGSR